MIIRLAALAALALPLGSCVGLGAGSEGVFEPAAVQPPSFERGNLATGKDAVVANPEARAERPKRTLTVPTR